MQLSRDTCPPALGFNRNYEGIRAPALGFDGSSQGIYALSPRGPGRQTGFQRCSTLTEKLHENGPGENEETRMLEGTLKTIGFTEFSRSGAPALSCNDNSQGFPTPALGFNRNYEGLRAATLGFNCNSQGTRAPALGCNSAEIRLPDLTQEQKLCSWI